MTLKCGPASKCMAKSLSLLQRRQRSFEYLNGTCWKSGVLRYSLTSLATFSTSRTCDLRLRPGQLSRTTQRARKQQYPGFRQETPEHRLIRENRLFDPYDSHFGDIDRLRAFQESKHGGTLPLKLATTSELEREMIWSATRAERGRGRALNILSILLRQRAQERKTVHYETLIALNASSDKGSAASVKSLLQEMDQQNIACDVNAYTSILRTLVVHPDIDTLNWVLHKVAATWIELDVEMLHYITAIYLRLDMPELALDYLDRIEGLSNPKSFATRSDPTKLQAGQADLWLYVMLINYLALQKDWEGVLRTCYRLHDDTSLGPFAMRQLDIPYAFWHRLLRKSAKANDRWVTSWIWNTWVVRNWFRPSIKLCTAVLRVFMHYGLRDHAYGTIKILRSFPVIAGHVKSSGRQRTNLSRRKLLIRQTKAYLEVAEKELGIMKPTEEQSRIAAHWTAFQHDSHSKTFAPAGMRLNPWSVLAKKGADPGELWARIANERLEEDLYANQIQDLAKLREKQGAIRSSVSEGLLSLPDQVQSDVQKLADMDFELRYRNLKRKRVEAGNASEPPSDHEEEDSFAFLDLDEQEVEFIDYESEGICSQSVQGEPSYRIGEPTPSAMSSHKYIQTEGPRKHSRFEER